MALRASLGADFSSFDQALKNVELRLKDTGDLAKNVGRDLSKMVEGFRGTDIKRQAELAAEGITRIGGVSKLTEAEQRKVNATVTEALAKYKALGQEAPAHLQKLADQTKQVEASTGKFASAISIAAGTFAGFLSAQTVMRGVSSAFKFAADSVVGMNATLETTTLQFTTMMGDADKAKAHVQSLFEFGAKTPFETGPIIEASRYMRLFGGDALDTAENLKRVGDAAATSGKPINEVGMWVARLYSGLKAGQPVGEATQRLMELGVMSGSVRAKVTELAASVEGGRGAWEYYSKELDKNNGAMEKMASTWEGVTSTLKDTITMTLATAFKPLFERFRDLIGQVNTIGGSTALQDWAARTAVQVDNLTISAVGFGASIAPVIGFIGTEFNAIQVLFRNTMQVIDLATLAVKGLALAALEAANYATPGGAFLSQRQRLRTEMGELVIAIDQRKIALQEDKKAEEDWGAAGAKMAATLKGVEERMRASQAATIARTTATAADTTTTDTWAASTKNATAATKASEAATAAWLAAWESRAKAGRDAIVAFGGSFSVMNGQIVQALRQTGSLGTMAFTGWAEPIAGTISGIDALLTKSREAQAATAAVAKAMGGLAAGLPKATTEMGAYFTQAKTGTEDTGESFETNLGKATDVVDLLSRAAEMSGHKTTAALLSTASATAKAFATGGPWAAAMTAASGLLTTFWSKLFGSAEARKDYAATDQIKVLQAELLRTYGSLEAIARAGGAAGAALVAAWGDRSQAGLKHFQELLDQFNAKVADSREELASLQQQLADRTVMDFERAQEIIERYGGTLDNLGQSFTAAKLAADWKSIWDDWEDLIDMGGDVGGTLVTMKEEISALVAESLRIGTEIPEQFRPLIEELIRTGQLLGANGEAITDISQLQFGAPLVSEVDKLLAKIDELIAALTTGLQPALDGLGTPVPEPWANWQAPQIPGVPTGPYGGDYGAGSGGHVYPQAAGGDYIVTRPTLFLAGEAGVERATFSGAGRTEHGGSTRPIEITLTLTSTTNLDGKEVARNQVRYLPNQLALAGV